METLSEKQRRFTIAVARLITYAYAKGYEMTFGEAWRTPEQAALNAKTGKGIKNSLHTQRLAIDLNLFKDGEYLTDSKDYKKLGDFWGSLGVDHIWGGEFGDGNHFSITYNGVK